LLENFFNKRDRELVEDHEKRTKPITMRRVAKLRMPKNRSRKQSIETVNLEDTSLEVRTPLKHNNGTPNDYLGKTKNQRSFELL